MNVFSTATDNWRPSNFEFENFDRKSRTSVRGYKQFQLYYLVICVIVHLAHVIYCVNCVIKCYHSCTIYLKDQKLSFKIKDSISQPTISNCRKSVFQIVDLQLSKKNRLKNWMNLSFNSFEKKCKS